MDDLRVAINVRPLLPGQIGGLEYAFRETCQRMLELFGDRLEVTLCTSATSHGSFGLWRGVVRRVLCTSPREMDAALRGHDVLWCPFFYLEPAHPPLPAVVSVPDPQHLHYPEHFSRPQYAERIRELRGALGYARRVLTPSESSRGEIVGHYPVEPERVVVVPHGVGEAFEAPVDTSRQEAVRRRYDLGPRYAIYPARPWPHKNHPRLLQALASYRDHFGEPPVLALTGFDSVPGTLLRMIRELGLGRLVKCLGSVPRDDLPHLYDGAEMLVFPSLFEGFGLPVLEAMRRGTPVVAASETSLPEVAGDSARWFDPRDPEAMAAAMRGVVKDPDGTALRVSSGLERARHFSLDAAATRTFDSLRAAACEKSTVSVVAKQWQPRVFVVTPSLDQGRFLRATVESVLAQDYPALDYFVADGGSSDDSAEILRGYGDRVRWQSVPDGGHSAAIRCAWQETDAEIVAWLNSDDTYLPGAVSAAVEHLREHPEAAMVYGQAWYTDARGHRRQPYPTWQPFRRSNLERNCFVCQPTVFLRREVFDVIDLPRADLTHAFDYDLWIRVSEHFRVSYLDRFLATYRIHGETKTVREKDRIYEEALAVAKQHFGSIHIDWITGFLHHRCKRVAGALLGIAPPAVRRMVFSRMARKSMSS